MKQTLAVVCALAAASPALALDASLTLPAKGETYAQPDASQPSNNGAPQAAADAERQPAPGSPADIPAPARPGFGDPGWWGITLGGGGAWDGNNISQMNLVSVGLSAFIARNLQLVGEVGGWAVLQEPGDDTGGGSLMIRARWHVWHTADYGWTVFLDGGLGFLYTGADVPRDGSNFNFTPELGGGFTMAMGQSARSARMEIGLRWRHLSNARLQGDDQNSGVDAVMIFSGMTFSF